jgi:hypothetical protein
MALFSDDAYNRELGNSDKAGSLIGNWFEERALREASGEGRTVPQRHLPRSGLLEDWTKVPDVVRKGDDTFERVYGPKSIYDPVPSSAAIGASDPMMVATKVGPKETMMRSLRADLAESEVQEEEAVVAKLDQARDFETAHARFYTKPDETQTEKATHGTKSCKDELYRGTPPDRMLALDNSGLEVDTRVHYSKIEPVTHTRMALADPKMGNDIQVSPQSGFAAFGKSTEFTKPVLEFTRGLSKDDELASMYEGLKSTAPLRTVQGTLPVGAPFAGVPSLAALKDAIHTRIGQVWGPHGYVMLRQQLFDSGDHEGFVSKDDVIRVLRNPELLGITPEEIDDRSLSTYLGQLVTMKKTELKISTFLSSVRPGLPQKDKKKVIEAFKVLEPTSGCVRLGDWLSRLTDPELRKTVVIALGAQDEESVTGISVTEPVFMELLSDLAPFMDINALLA